MTKNWILDELFDVWKDVDATSNFVTDGIIDEGLYEDAKLKILFVMKEPNDPNGTGWDFREHFRNNNLGVFGKTLAVWAHGILNKDLNGDFPTWEEYAYEEAYHSLRHTAFMNVKKTGGKGFSNALEMIEYTKKHFENIRTEIDIIDPKLIITGFSWPNLRDAVFPDVVHKDWLNTGYNVFWNMDRSDRIILDFYHPSSRIPETVSYVMLEKMIKLIGI